MILNRCRPARKNAGLSVGQAARLLGVPRELIERVEESDDAYAAASPSRFADIYGVNLDWLGGRSALCDYTQLMSPDVREKMTFCERDMLAELFASLPRVKINPL